jgi:SAM-dependent methyltransferase
VTSQNKVTAHPEPRSREGRSTPGCRRTIGWPWTLGHLIHAPIGSTEHTIVPMGVLAVSGMVSDSETVTIDPGNADQASAWNGESGQVWTEHDRAFNRSVAGLTVPFLAAAAISDGERVLDVGCGSGETTREIARRTPRGSALGLDLSGPLLALAAGHTREAGIDNVDYLQADAQVYPLVPSSFDVAVSRMGSMFFADPVAAFRNIGAALRPGGRLVLLVWQDAADNEWFVAFTRALSGPDAALPPPGSPGPYSLALPDDVHSILGAAGFVDVALEPCHEPLSFGTVDEGYALQIAHLGWRLRDLDADTANAARVALRATLQDHLTADGAVFDSATWIVTARRA